MIDQQGWNMEREATWPQLSRLIAWAVGHVPARETGEDLLAYRARLEGVVASIRRATA